MDCTPRRKSSGTDGGNGCDNFQKEKTMARQSGIHHITAIASDPRKNHDFYTQVLGLRFIKKTVNFDDPSTYHFYFGDKVGAPGTILTFFPHPGSPKGRQGIGQAAGITFAVPQAALSFWIGRFHQKGIKFEGPEHRFGAKFLRFTDPDGLMLELAALEGAPDQDVWATENIGADVAIRGFHSVALWVEGYEKTAAILTEHLGFRLEGNEENRFRFSTGKRGLGQTVDVCCLPGFWHGAMGAGTVHHVAWRVGGDEEEADLRTVLLKDGLNLTPVIDRNYFHSVYFREPGGVLFELATDNPGFAVDEPLESLGTELKLPAQYEPHREAIAAALPPLD
jgi:catechol 2,3-dioxygenase-like lactoylglutathione lyase family enzyme